MIYIFTEDSKDGKNLIDCILKVLYTENVNNIKLDTLGGIQKATDKLKDKIQINNIDINNDYVIVVIDDVQENVAIKSDIVNIINYCKQFSHIKLVTTQSFEVEILKAECIEYLGDIEAYDKYFKELRSMTQTYVMTNYIKNNKDTYGEFIERVLKVRKKKKHNVSDKILLNTISVETISKLILSKVFKDYGNLKPISGNCWAQNCCFKANCKKYNTLDFDKIHTLEAKTHLCKLQKLAASTQYIQVFQEIDSILKINASKQLAGTLRDIIKTSAIKKQNKITKQVLQANLVRNHIAESQDNN